MDENLERVVRAIAAVGDGEKRGHRGVAVDSLSKELGISTQALRDIVELNWSLFDAVQSRKTMAGLVTVGLSPVGREAAFALGAVPASPVADAEAVRAHLASVGDGRSSLSSEDLDAVLQVGLARLRDAASVLENDGRAKADHVLGGRFYISLTARGRAQFEATSHRPAKPGASRPEESRSSSTGSLEPQQRSPQAVDFVIITALEEERDALLSKLPGYRKLDKQQGDTRTYYEAQLASRREDRSAYRVIATCLADMGPVAATAAAAAVVSRWNPRHVLLVGIACGIPGETGHGDVLLSKQVADYTLGKVDAEGRRIRWEVHRGSANLLDSAANLAPVDWHDLISVKRPGDGEPARIAGVIASGGDVVSHDEVIAEYRSMWGKLVGIEMEAGGVAGGLHHTDTRPEFLMIKAVSDHGKDKKDPAIIPWRLYACDVAAAFAVGMIRSGPKATDTRSGGIGAGAKAAILATALGIGGAAYLGVRDQSASEPRAGAGGSVGHGGEGGDPGTAGGGGGADWGVGGAGGSAGTNSGGGGGGGGGGSSGGGAGGTGGFGPQAGGGGGGGGPPLLPFLAETAQRMGIPLEQLLKASGVDPSDPILLHGSRGGEGGAGGGSGAAGGGRGGGGRPPSEVSPVPPAAVQRNELTEGQRSVLQKELSALGRHSVALTVVGDDPSATILFKQLSELFQDAGRATARAAIGDAQIVGQNFPRYSYMTGANISSPLVKSVFSSFAQAGVSLPLVPDAFTGGGLGGSDPDLAIVIR